MVRKKESLIIFSLALAVIFFSSGLLLGLSFDEMRIKDLYKKNQEYELELNSFLLEEEMFKEFNYSDCSLLFTKLEDLSERLNRIGKILSNYESKGLWHSEEYKFLKKKYFIWEIHFLLTIKRLLRECNLNRTVIIFFYKQGDENSLQQGYQLDEVVNELGYGNINVLSFDIEENMSLLHVLKNIYNVTKAPSIIINFKIKKEGLVRKKEILSLIKNDSSSSK